MLTSLIKWGAIAMRLYHGFRAAAVAVGMSAEEFDDSVTEEIKRLDEWEAETNAAEDGVFDGETTKP